MSARRTLEESIRHHKSHFGLAESVLLYELRNQAYAYDFGYQDIPGLKAWRDAKLLSNTTEMSMFNNWLAAQPVW